MESSKNLNKGEGGVGSLDVDSLHSRMQRLKGVDAGRKPDANITKPIGVFQNPNAPFKGDRVMPSSLAGRGSRIIGRYLETHVSPNMVSSLEGDHISVSSLACNTSPSLNQPNRNVFSRFTSLGESTNPSLSTMDPSKDPNATIDDDFCSVPSPTSGTLGDQTEVPIEIISETPMVQSVEINTNPTSYVGAAGKRIAFPVVEYYARNNWAKHGLKRIMMNAKGFFFLKFDTRAGLEAVLEGGPWMIRNSPIILKKWSMKTSLHKEELTRIPIWVKLHDVPIQVFEEDDISLIATYIGKPIMLDSYTSSMCKDSWEMSSFARCLIEINSEADFKESITIVGKDFAFKPKAPNVSSNGDNGARDEPLSKAGPSNTNYGGESQNTKDTNARKQDTGKKKISNITSPNPFAALGVDDDEEEKVENVWDEYENLNL
ncbi:zinc knuckle CX2CX4HX4C containing protein [Tanacetum coccineum]